MQDEIKKSLDSINKQLLDIHLQIEEKKDEGNGCLLLVVAGILLKILLELSE